MRVMYLLATWILGALLTIAGIYAIPANAANVTVNTVEDTIEGTIEGTDWLYDPNYQEVLTYSADSSWLLYASVDGVVLSKEPNELCSRNLSYQYRTLDVNGISMRFIVSCFEDTLLMVPVKHEDKRALFAEVAISSSVSIDGAVFLTNGLRKALKYAERMVSID